MNKPPSYDAGKYIPDRHPFIGIDRMLNGIGAVKKEVPDMVVYELSLTYLRQYADLFMAGVMEEGRINPKRVCLTCGKCIDLIRVISLQECAVRDPEIFLPFYREFAQTKSSLPKNFRG